MIPARKRGSIIVTHPDSDEAVLWQPGSALVVRTVTALKLLVEVSPLEHDGSTAAVVNVEALTFGDPPALPSGATREPRGRATSLGSD